MIKINELRIGNYVLMSGVIVRMDNKLFHAVLNGFNGYEPEPIPLTEDILLKCGFELEEKLNDYRFNDSEFYVNKNKITGDFWVYMSNGDEDACLTSIEYLHQLQNIYFALTGQELTFNLWV